MKNIFKSICGRFLGRLNVYNPPQETTVSELQDLDLQEDGEDEAKKFDEKYLSVLELAPTSANYTKFRRVGKSYEYLSDEAKASVKLDIELLKEKERIAYKLFCASIERHIEAATQE